MKDNLRKLERFVYRAPEIKKEDFPILPGYEQDLMRLEAEISRSIWMEKGYRGIGFVYVREWKNNAQEKEGKASWFIDIYFRRYTKSNTWMQEQESQRIIIAPGYQMSEKDEELLFDLTEVKYARWDPRTCHDFIEEISKAAPELNINSHTHSELDSNTLLHAYFASFRSGIRELMYKAGGLDYIAGALYRLDGMDLLAPNIETAFNGIPIAMLRKLNHSNAVATIINTESRRREMAHVYKAIANKINDMDSINYYQCCYIKCFLDGTVDTFDKHLLRNLSDLNGSYVNEEGEWVSDDSIYKIVMGYKQLLDDNPKYRNIFPKYPDFYDIGRFLDNYYMLRKYVEHEKEIDDRFELLAPVWKKEYTYEGEEYVVIAPTTIKDIIFEAQHQHNCLISYIPQIVNGRTSIIFMREKSQMGKSFITVEVRHGRIMQALGNCNRTIEPKEHSFLIQYALDKGLGYGAVAKRAENYLKVSDYVDSVIELEDRRFDEQYWGNDDFVEFVDDDNDNIVIGGYNENDDEEDGDDNPAGDGFIEFPGEFVEDIPFQ